MNNEKLYQSLIGMELVSVRKPSLRTGESINLLYRYGTQSKCFGKKDQKWVSISYIGMEHEEMEQFGKYTLYQSLI